MESDSESAVSVCEVITLRTDIAKLHEITIEVTQLQECLSTETASSSTDIDSSAKILPTIWDDEPMVAS